MQSPHRTHAIIAVSPIAALALAVASVCLPDAAAAAKNRAVYSAGNTTALPGTLMRAEGGPPTGDVDVDAVYDATGDVYDAFQSFWNRDSYDGAGAPIRSTVHYATNFCNAQWNGSQLVFGDGNPAQGCGPLGRALDVVAHEYTKAVIEQTSGLVFSGEPGGLMIGLSDIFAAFTEAWVAGDRTGALAPTADTWTIGEDVLTPALRSMDDPAEDGVSLDYWTSAAGNADVHYSAGIVNLAFYLLSQGGVHPRGRSTIAVNGIGMEKAIRIFYAANRLLGPSSRFHAARTACLGAASQLGYTAEEQNAVADAWAAVGVGASSQVPPPDITDVVLTNRVPVTGLSSANGDMRFFKLEVPAGATNLRFVLARGTGDADLYVRLGSRPTLSSFNCRSWTSTNAESCNFALPAPGTYYVMLNAFRPYEGTMLTGSYDVGLPPGDPYLASGVPVPDLTGAAGSSRYFRIAAVPGRPVTVRIAGGIGDADLYVRFGSRPTTSTYACRPYKSDNNETCTLTSASAGDYYIMLRGFRSYSGVTLTGTN